MKKHIKNAINNLNQDTPYQIFDLDISDKQKNMLGSIKTFGGKYQENYNAIEIVTCAFKPNNYEAVQQNITTSLENIFEKLNTNYNAENDNESIQEFISYSHNVANAFISANEDYHVSQNAKQIIVAFLFNNQKVSNAFHYHVDGFDDLSEVNGPRMLYSMVGNSTYYKINNSLEERQKYVDSEFENIFFPEGTKPKDGDHHKANSSTQAAVDFSSANEVTVYPAIHSAPHHNPEEIENGRVLLSISFSNRISDKYSCEIQGQNDFAHDEL